MSNRALDFEYMVRLFLGPKADHIASCETNERNRRSWLQKVIKRMLKQIDSIDTTTRHKQILLAEVDSLYRRMKSQIASPWDINYSLFRLCGLLLGFDSIRGVVLHTPVYHQTKAQYYGENIMEGGDPLLNYYDEKDAIAIRKRLVDELKEKGLDDFKIALVLNITEYQVKKLRKNL